MTTPPPPPPAPLLPSILTPDIGKSRSPSVKLLLPAVLVSTGGRDSGEGETVECTCPVPRATCLETVELYINRCYCHLVLSAR